MSIMYFQDFNRILQKFPFGYQSLDENGVILNVNDKWLNLMGYDDKEEVISQRLETYRNQTEPLIRFYTYAGTLSRIEGVGGVDSIYAAIKSDLGLG